MKKIIALILALSLFGTSALAFSSSTLSQFGMNFSEDDSRLVLRVEFIDNILKLLFIEPQSSSPQVFSDVKETDSVYGIIMAAYDAGIIHGEPGMEFRPEEPVTYEEAIRILVDILNYDSYIGAGETYQSVASMIKLTDGIKYNNTAYVNEKDMSKLILNAIDIPMFEIKYDNIHHIQVEGKTLLEKNNIHKGRGIVQGVNRTAVDPGIKTGPKFVTIGSELFQTDGKNYDEYLGCSVDYLYHDDHGNYTLISMELSSETEIKTIQLDDVDSCQNRTLYYYVNNKLKRAQFSSDVSIIYNGAPIEKMTEALFLGDNGFIKLISSDGSSMYDTVIITKYEDYFVDVVDVKNEIVYDKYNVENGLQRSLDLSNIDDDKIVDKNGKSVEISDISKYNVLSVLIKDNGEIEKVIVNSTSIEGVIRKVQSTDNYILIDKTGYKGTDILFNNENISVTLSGTFYLNANNMIAGIYIENKGETQYGYIRKVWENEGGGSLGARILTTDNQTKVFEFKNKFSIDGERDNHSLTKLEGVLSDSNGFLPQVIRYSTDSEGRISYLDTVKSNGKGQYDSLKNIYEKKSNIRFRNAASNFGNHLLIGADTIMFRVPDETDPLLRGTYAASKYRVITKADLIAELPYTVAGYTSKENQLLPELIVNYAVTNQIKTSSPICVVTEVNAALNADGDEVICISYISMDGEDEAVLESKDVIDGEINIKEGDVIRVAKNAGGEIEFLQYIYSIDDEMDDTTNFRSSVANSALDAHASFILTKGYLFKKVDNVIALARKSVIESGEELTLDDMVTYDASSTVVIIYDSSRQYNKAYIGNIAELVECVNGNLGDFVICHTNNSALKTIYVIKK